MMFWVIYVSVHLLTYYLIVHVLGKAHLKFKDDNEVKRKFGPFLRNDLEKWGIIKCFPFYITFWPRVLMGCLNAFLFSTWVMICMTGHDTSLPKISRTRYLLISTVGRVAARLHCAIASLWWFSPEYVSEGEGDYKKWLGPDWKPQWTGTGTIVANHVCWMDICMSMYVFFPSFLGKKSIKSYPFIGKISMAVDSFFVDRAGTKEEKIAVAKAIEARQLENEQTGRPPLLIFPEGATTNNESLIQFKRGPFSGLNSVQPVGFKYWSINGISPQNDTISQFHFFFVMMSGFTTLRMKIYPVFKPN